MLIVILTRSAFDVAAADEELDVAVGAHLVWVVLHAARGGRPVLRVRIRDGRITEYVELGLRQVRVHSRIAVRASERTAVDRQIAVRQPRVGINRTTATLERPGRRKVTARLIVHEHELGIGLDVLVELQLAEEAGRIALVDALQVVRGRVVVARVDGTERAVGIDLIGLSAALEDCRG